MIGGLTDARASTTNTSIPGASTATSSRVEKRAYHPLLLHPFSLPSTSSYNQDIPCKSLLIWFHLVSRPPMSNAVSHSRFERQEARGPDVVKVSNVYVIGLQWVLAGKTKQRGPSDSYETSHLSCRVKSEGVGFLVRAIQTRAFPILHSYIYTWYSTRVQVVVFT